MKSEHEIAERCSSPIADNSTHSKKTLWEKLDELTDELPEDVARELPVDGAEEHDHYIYGWPKRNQKK